jgi:hypothetical protein
VAAAFFCQAFEAVLDVEFLLLEETFFDFFVFAEYRLLAQGGEATLVRVMLLNETVVLVLLHGGPDLGHGNLLHNAIRSPSLALRRPRTWPQASCGLD